MNMTDKNSKAKKEQKTDRANQIGKHAKWVKERYDSLKKGILWIFRWFSYFIDHVFFNLKYGKIVALVLAILTYAVVNYNSLSSLYSASLKTAREKTGVEVIAEYNVDEYEVSGLPETVDVTIIGDATSVTSAYNAQGAVVANLNDYAEGTYEVTLTTQNFGDNVTVKPDPSTVSVTIKKKVTQTFTISYDYVNRTKMDSIYTLGSPTFDVDEVSVRASQDTLNSIAVIKALIDVNGATENFETDATLVAYDTSGQLVNADIVPSSVHVSVPVSSASKSVPLVATVVGDVPNEKAVESIQLSQDSVVIYGSENTLSKVSSVNVVIDGTTLNESGEYSAILDLPDGVTCPNISEVKANVTLNMIASKVMEDVPISFINDSKFTATSTEEITTVSVTITGTTTNIEKVKASDIEVYVDLKNVKSGTQELELQVTQPEGGIVKYSLEKTSYEFDVTSK